MLSRKCNNSITFLPCYHVGIYKMVKDIDAGEVLWEEFLDVNGCRTESEIYYEL